MRVPLHAAFGLPAACLMLAAALAASLPGGALGQSRPLTKLVFATASGTPIILFMNVEIGAALGFFEQEGIAPEFLHTGSNAAVTTLLAQGKVQVGVGVPNFQVSYAARGKALPGINFYEYAYPLKWDMAVAPDSPLKSLTQMKGRTLGLLGRGTADENVAKSFLSLSGVEPSAVEYVVVGQGTPGGVALHQKRIDAMLVWDTTLGQWDVAGIAYRLLPRPKNLKPVGGFYIQATPKFISERRELAVGFARAVAKGTVFALANLEAASDVYLKLHPDAAGQGKSRRDAVKTVALIVGKRAAHWVREGTEYADAGVLLGRMDIEEWRNEVEFAGAGATLKNPAQFFTNDLIKAVNDFDRQAIIAMARAYKMRE